MTLRLSINRCGFDMNLGELRAAITDLTRLAAEMGAAIGVLNSTAADTRITVSVLRAHRGWLLDQAELLSAKLRLHEDRNHAVVIRQSLDGMAVTLPVFAAPVTSRAERAVL